LSISGVRHRLALLSVTNQQLAAKVPLVVSNSLQADVPQVGIRDIANKDPSHFKHTFPLVRCPYSTTSRVVHPEGRTIRTHGSRSERYVLESTFPPFHKSVHWNDGEYAPDINQLPSIHAEKKVDGTPSSSFFEGLVKSLISGIRKTPYLVLQRFVNIIFCV
jgi:hypothetical protein